MNSFSSSITKNKAKKRREKKLLLDLFFVFLFLLAACFCTYFFILLPVYSREITYWLWFFLSGMTGAAVFVRGARATFLLLLNRKKNVEKNRRKYMTRVKRERHKNIKIRKARSCAK